MAVQNIYPGRIPVEKPNDLWDRIHDLQQQFFKEVGPPMAGISYMPKFIQWLASKGHRDLAETLARSLVGQPVNPSLGPNSPTWTWEQLQQILNQPWKPTPAPSPAPVPGPLYREGPQSAPAPVPRPQPGPQPGMLVARFPVNWDELRRKYAGKQDLLDAFEKFVREQGHYIQGTYFEPPEAAFGSWLRRKHPEIFEKYARFLGYETPASRGTGVIPQPRKQYSPSRRTTEDTSGAEEPPAPFPREQPENREPEPEPIGPPEEVDENLWRTLEKQARRIYGEPLADVLRKRGGMNIAAYLAEMAGLNINDPNIRSKLPAIVNRAGPEEGRKQSVTFTPPGFREQPSPPPPPPEPPKPEPTGPKLYYQQEPPRPILEYTSNATQPVTATTPTTGQQPQSVPTQVSNYSPAIAPAPTQTTDVWGVQQPRKKQPSSLQDIVQGWGTQYNVLDVMNFARQNPDALKNSLNAITKKNRVNWYTM